MPRTILGVRRSGRNIWIMSEKPVTKQQMLDAGMAFQRFGLAVEFISSHEEFFDRWAVILSKLSEDENVMVTLIQTAFQEYLEETDHFKNPPKELKPFVEAVTRRFEAGLLVSGRVKKAEG